MLGSLLPVRSLVRRTVNRLGYDIVRYAETCEHPLNVLALAVRDQLARDPSFFFVQVGANDGVRSDPLRPLVLQHGLPGLLIEPLPDEFARLRHNYADQPQLRFENCAIAETDGTRDLFRMRRDAPVPDWAHGLASFHADHLTSIVSMKQYVERVPVPTKTLATVFAEHDVPAVSLLQVDVEGYDYAVVRLAFQAGCFPCIVHYEHCNLTPGDKVECQRLLKRHNYRFSEVGRDTLAIRQD